MIFLYRDHYERRRAPPKRESASDELSLKIPLSYLKKGQKLHIDYAVPRDDSSDSASIEQYVGTLVAMDQHQNTLLDTDDGERFLLRGARVIKIRVLTSE